jgi:hypothetical protein
VGIDLDALRMVFVNEICVWLMRIATESGQEKVLPKKSSETFRFGLPKPLRPIFVLAKLSDSLLEAAI